MVERGTALYLLSAAALIFVLCAATAFVAPRLSCDYREPEWCVIAESLETPALFARKRGARVHWYDVSGTTLRALAEDMRDHGPIDEFGVHRAALTDWSVQWRWPTDEHGANFGRVAVKSRVELTLPRLADPHALSEPQLREWSRFSNVIYRHELGHAANGFLTARRVAAAIRAASADLHTELDANRVGWHEISAGRARDRQFDASTQHGRLQGVRLAQ